MQRTFSTILLCAGLSLAQEHTVIFERKVAPPPGAPGKEPTVFFFSSGGENIKGAPYSADSITESTQVLADGNRITRTNKSSFARDGEGRTRRDSQIQSFGPLGAAKEAAVSTFIEDPVAKVNYTLDSRNKLAFKSTRGEGGPNVRFKAKGGEGGPHMVEDVIIERVPGGAGVAAGAVVGATTRIERNVNITRMQPGKDNIEDLGERNFEGVIAKGKRVQMKIPAGEIGNEREIEVVTETWFSEQLKTMVYTKHSDPRFGETVTRLTNIKLGEPPASLFDVPADYKVESMQNMRMPMPAMVRE